MGKADLHIHTNCADGIDSIEAIFEFVETCTDLDVIAITEHDDLDVSLGARDIWARDGYRFELMTGVEVTTLDGHLVALGVEEPVPGQTRVEEAVEAVRRQDGLCFAPHPLSPLARSIKDPTFMRLAKDGLNFDAIELATSSPVARLYLSKARRLNQLKYRLPSVGSSDAHFIQAIGTGFTVFEGHTAADLQKALRAGAVAGGDRPFPGLREIGVARLGAMLAACLGKKAASKVSAVPD